MIRRGVATVLVAVCLSAARCEGDLGNRPLVETKCGPILGREMTSRGGRRFSAFTSIPYAKPPVGERRFKPPEPVDSWNGTLDATKELEFCLQVPIYDPFLRNISRGTDDCLYLNVFSPNLTGSLAVMFYTHGGGFRSSLPGNGPATRSKYLMDEDVVLVTPNYRVGVLGFLSTEDEVISGNFGLKDQVAALKWVKENIKAFGGNPSRVTVFGESAGGASSHLLLLSPASRDLLAGGIAQSGVAHGIWATAAPGVARYRAHTLAESLSCPTEPHSHLLSCLLTKSSKELIESDWKFNVDDFNPTILYQPVIESKDVQEPFLTDSPYNLINEDKPFIAGLNSGEGAFKIASYKAQPEFLDNFISNLDGLLPEFIMYTNTSSQVKNITADLKKKFLSGENLLEGISDMTLDAFFLIPILKAVNSTKSPVYIYLFDHRGKTAATDILSMHAGVNFGDLGVAHTDELLYLFNFEDEVPDMKTLQDTEVSKKLVKLWANFAKYGAPTTDEDEMKWDRFEKDKSYLRITSNEIKMETGYRSDHINFWLSLPIRDKMEQMGL